MEVVNKSSLNIVKGSSSNGYVAYYAKQVITNESQSKLSTDENGFVIYNDGNVVYLIDYVGEETTVSIPNTVTSINNKALNNKTFTSVSVPSSVTSIGNYAFMGCSSLESISLPNSVSSIGICAFQSCSKLTSITIPTGVTSISSTVFSNCISLETVILHGNVTEILAYAFSGCTKLSSIIIPSSVISMGAYVFNNCSSLTIYCEHESQPANWQSTWNPQDRPVVWGYSGE